MGRSNRVRRGDLGNQPLPTGTTSHGAEPELRIYLENLATRTYHEMIEILQVDSQRVPGQRKPPSDGT